MPHFYVSPGSIQGDRFSLKKDEAHHLATVLRKTAGDEIDLFDGAGNAYRARLESVAPGAVAGRILSRLQAPGLAVRARLFQGLPKGDKMEWILEKAAELGAAELVPVLTERSVGKIPNDRLPLRLARWDKILRAAAKQCGRATLPELRPPQSLEDALGLCAADDLTLIPWEAERALSLKRLLAGRAPTPPKTVNIFIGPEGGFSPKEVDAAKQAGAQAVTLGPLILRTETAGLFVLSVLWHEFGGKA